MPLPIMTTKEDVDKVIAFLKKKPVGVTVDEAKATIGTKLIDGRKLNAYRTWGLITDKGNKLELTTLGRKYSQASEEGKQELYLDIIRDEKIYNLTVEWIQNQGFDQVPASEVASHWYAYFRNEIGTDNEQGLTNQVICFMNIVDAAGLGEYKIGRQGHSTRLEINQGAVQRFIEESHSDKDSSSNDAIPTSVVSPNISPSTESKPEVPNFGTYPPPSYVPPQPSPSLHIDIQIHIASDATLEQIDQIFASMAKHLYNKMNG
jgi:hypothetical protein